MLTSADGFFRVMVPTDEARRLVADRLAVLEKEGFDSRGVFQYAIHLASYCDYPSLAQYVASDLLAVNPYLAETASHYRRVLHNCLDAIGEVSKTLIPYVERVCGRCDHHVRFERFVGNDMLVNVSP